MKSIMFFALLLGIACSAPAEESERLSSENQAIIVAKRLEIEGEIARLKNHSWAGSYYMGDGLGANIQLIMAPENGFTITWNGCLGLYDQNYGSVAFDGNFIKLSFVLDRKDSLIGNLGSKYQPVRWGNRVYMIPADEIMDFTNAINSGQEPRDQMQGLFLLRKGDEKKKVKGRPELPEKFIPYLLGEPVVATIISVKNIQKNEDLEITPVVLDKGRKDGLLPGMTLHITEPDDPYNIGRVVKLTEVGETQAEGEFRRGGPSDDWAPKVGWQLSSCFLIRCGRKK